MHSSVVLFPHRDGQAVIIDPGETPLRLAADSTALQHGATFTIEACLQIRSVYETAAVRTPSTPSHAALADLCHVILNSNEFLYVR